jgi:hypothetical protein
LGWKNHVCWHNDVEKNNNLHLACFSSLSHSLLHYPFVVPLAWYVRKRSDDRSFSYT